jgi:hypothetical protein
MTEILTESFCERCGTRYTFESARPRVRLKGVKVLSRGLKNFVMSDDSSIDEAMAAARSDTDRELTAHQLDAFHKTFNFCMSCRQYTCPNCWNQAEARCLTCAPHLGHEVLPAPFPDLVTSSYIVADPVDVVPQQNGANGPAAIADEPPPAEATPSNVDITDFATRLQALMSPPDVEGGATIVSDPVAPTVPAVEDVAVEAAPEADVVASVEAAPEADVVAAVDSAAPVEAPPAVEAVADVEADAWVETQPGVEAAIPYVIADEPWDEAAVVDAGQVEAAPEAVLGPDVEFATSEPVPVEPELADEVGSEVEAVGSAIPYVIEDVAAAAHAEAPLEAEVVAADIESVPAQDASTIDEQDDAAHIAARLAAFGAGAAIIDTAAEEGFGPKADAREKGVAATSGLLRRFRAGRDLDAEIARYEQEQAEAFAASSPDALVSEHHEPMAAALDAEAIAAFEASIASEAQSMAVAAEPPTLDPDAAQQDVAATVLMAAAAEGAAPMEPQSIPEPPVDVIPQPTWQIVAPEPATEIPSAPPIAPSPSIPAAAQANAEPQWPTRPEWPGGVPPAAGLPFLNRPPTPTGGLEALWAESAREVVAPPPVPGRPAATGGVQPCVSCGLSLSATARFCRRCGTPQAS